MTEKRTNDEALLKQPDLFYDIALTSTGRPTTESQRSPTEPLPSVLRQTSMSRKESRESSMPKMPISRNTSAGGSSTSSALRKLSENQSAGSGGGGGVGSVTFDESTLKKKPNFHKMSSQSSVMGRRGSDSLVRGGSLPGENIIHVREELPEILDEGSDTDTDDNDEGAPPAGDHTTADEDIDSSSADAPEFYTIALPPGAVLLGNTESGDLDRDQYSPSPPVSPSLRESYSRIPHIGASRSKLGRLFWTIVFICCTIAFVLHTYHTVSLYIEYSTIIQMKLEFGAAPFPAVTICNLNPYKFGLIKNVSEVRDRKIFKLDEKLYPPTNESKRTKRQVIYEPWLARCRCQRPRVKECVPTTSDWESDFATCLCYYDVNTGNIWPCYDVTVWTEHRCANCSTTNACPYPPKKADWYKGEKDEACICQGISKFCVRRPKGPFKQWKGPEYDNYYLTTTEPPKPSTEAPKNVVPMNSNTRAIEAQEQLTYILARMEPDRRRELSYNTEEFIILCSFDGSPCDKMRDFQIHDTPRQGNCYTYNFNASVNLTNTRAGPLYGLRLLVNVNQSDYLDFIEGAGVRLVVHHQNQYPFPDTFGYSAPVGAISSFGIKLKRLKRLGYPWSKCTDVRKYSKAGYLFDEEYSTEGCFRSHLQNTLVRRCQCANPRFPTTHNMTICDFDNDTQKLCIQREEEYVEKCQDDECKCFQPCDEIVYQTTYSAASWPSENFVNNTECSINNRNNLSCFEYFRRHTSFVEVFYEQLNYEVLTEVEAYTVLTCA
uniref:Uncharacterized protein n=1 Tax=Romanomermis culicivorax TaxID=13658 RepID=A0A915JLF1_ROMCU